MLGGSAIIFLKGISCGFLCSICAEPARLPGESSRRLQEDSYARLKYDSTAGRDGVIIDRVAKLAAQKGVSMTEYNLVGVMAQNTQDSAKESHVWSAGNQKI